MAEEGLFKIGLLALALFSVIEITDCVGYSRCVDTCEKAPDVIECLRFCRGDNDVKPRDLVTPTILGQCQIADRKGWCMDRIIERENEQR